LKKCKTEGCNNPVWGNGLCVNHKPRTGLVKKSSLLTKKLDKSEEVIRQTVEMREFFLQIWKKRLHLSEVSGLPLIGEPLSVYFHHILPKSKYPQACLDEENIILLTWEEHDQVEMDMYRYEDINNRREQLKQKYNV
jgi:hypothetical protein